MSNQNHHVAVSNQNYLFDQLGIQGTGNQTFNPKNQQIAITIQNQNNAPSKYAAKYSEDTDQWDNDAPITNNRQLDRKVQDKRLNNHIEKGSSTLPPINKNKKVKKVMRVNRRGAKPNNRNNQESNKQQMSADIGMNQVAQWAEKGTKVNHGQDNDSFQSDVEKQANSAETSQQLQIKKRIQEKLKKYENPGNVKKHEGNTLSSLKNKAQSLKRQKQTGLQSLDQTNQTLKAKNNLKIQQRIQEQEEDEETNKIDSNKLQQKNINNQKSNFQEEQSEESEDPWDNINQKTLAQKQSKNQKVQFLEENKQSLISFYQKYPINQQQSEEEEQPETGFFQELCACFMTKKKRKTETQKRLMTVAKVKLTNTPEQMALLKEIWIEITNKKFLRYGEHWNEVGFQNRDPATDLRSAGVLSLVQWYGFILEHKQFELKISNFCVEFDIPLALTHIKITSLVISSIKKGLLDGRQWKDFQQWYNSFIFYTFEYILKNGKNIDQIGQLVQEAVDKTMKNMQKAKSEYLSQHIK